MTRFSTDRTNHSEQYGEVALSVWSGVSPGVWSRVSSVSSCWVMDIFSSLEAQLRLHHRRPLPARWLADPVLSEWDSLQAVVAEVRRVRGRSDLVVGALLRRGREDADACAVLLVGLAPFAIHRCGGRRALVDDFVGELALVIGEFDERCVQVGEHGLVSLLISRAWDRVRAHGRQGTRAVPHDPAEVQIADDTSWGDPERVAVNRVALEMLRADLARDGRGRRPTLDAWNSAVALAGRPRQTASEQNRWKYVRRQLRRQISSDIAA